MLARLLLATPLVLALAAPASAQLLAPAPEGATGRSERALGFARRHMAAAANPLAAEAGREMLRAGGSAIDAAIATQFVLNVVEPQSSGIGGGAFIVHFERRSGRVTTLDGREAAPAAATPERFLQPDGRPLPFDEAVVGGRSVGVPGAMRVLEEAHRRWGRLPWARLFEPAIRLAGEGFPVSPRLSGLLAQERFLQRDPLARALFYREDGSALPVGHVLRQPALAATFRTLAERGAGAFYEGEIAADIVERVRGHATNPGDMTLDDLAAYRAVERPAVCGPYRSFTICGMGPPSSGGVAVLQTLGLLEAHDMARLGPGPEAAHLLTEAGRLAFADRNLYLGDPDFVGVPLRGLLDAGYLAERARLVVPGGRSMGTARAGIPPFRRADPGLPTAEPVERGTSHVSVVDRDGDAVSMTTTIEAGFGARLMTRSGFLLNNQLTDFNFAPTTDGRPAANRVEAGKRPRSSMSPTLVFDAFGRLYAVVGSPGGSQIIGYVTKTLVAILDWRMDPQRAIDFGHVLSRNGPTELEEGAETAAFADALRARGHEVRVAPMTSGLQAIVVTPYGLEGGADGRREGVAVGD
jgi:gamma-glutamyltranspeptidase/glutathione hydrolase